MAATTVFFSWQSDTRTSEGRNFIERALEMAVKRISNELQIEEAPRGLLQIDKDTKDVPGSPPIFETIRRKIDAAAIFIPDLTFVAKRPNGDPCPNPNVLIEYGYALKSLTYHRIVAVMNAAFGPPARESLPFDLASYRFPIAYNLPEGASEDDRKVARDKLTTEFERAIKGVLTSEQYKQSLPQPLPVSYRKPLDGRARFRPKGEPLGMAWSPMQNFLGGSDFPVDLAEGAAVWLRVMPQQLPAMVYKQSEIRERLQGIITLPLYNAYSNTLAFRGSDGAGICMPLNNEPTPCVVYVFSDCEIWTIDTFSLRSTKQLIVLNENAFTRSLQQCAQFISEVLKVPGPYRWVAGMEGIKGRSIPLGGPLYRTRGPCLNDLIEHTGTFNIGDKAAATLEPFFAEIYEQCGAKRPAPPASSAP